VDIAANVKNFRGDGQPERRFASFDYCFNYFQSFWEDDSVIDVAAVENMPLSCLHLGGLCKTPIITSLRTIT
jgi:hypothetical protein